MTIIDAGNGFEITDRDVVPYGVPTFRTGPKYGGNVPTALDVMPRGAPSDNGSNGVVWLDLCNADMLANPNVPVSCLFGGISSSGKATFGTRAFNGAKAGPLDLIVDRKVVGRLTEDGLEIFGTVKANAFGGAALPEDPGEIVSYTFNGSNYEMLNMPPTGQGDFSQAFWFKGTQNTRADIITQANGYNSAGWYGLLLNVSSPNTLAWYENTTAKMAATVPWNDGNWHHVEITRSGNVLYLFFDGVLVATAQTSFNYGAVGVMARLGRPTYAAFGFVGKVDDLVVSAVALHTNNFTPPERQN